MLDANNIEHLGHVLQYHTEHNSTAKNTVFLSMSPDFAWESTREAVEGTTLVAIERHLGCITKISIPEYLADKLFVNQKGFELLFLVMKQD